MVAVPFFLISLGFEANPWERPFYALAQIFMALGLYVFFAGVKLENE
jgi:hypothetical protein